MEPTPDSPAPRRRRPGLNTLLGLLATLAVTAVALWQFVERSQAQGYLPASQTAWLVIAALGATLAAGLAALAAALLGRSLSTLAGRISSLLARLGRWNWVIFAALAAAVSSLPLGRYAEFFEQVSVRMWLVWLAALAGMVLLAGAGRAGGGRPSSRRPWVAWFAASLMLAAAIYRIVAYLPEITDYPFSLGWSEASRYYYASLYFSRQLYGMDLPPTVLHPSRYLLQAIPFLFGGVGIWFHRLWQIGLWVGLVGGCCLLLARRFGLGGVLRWSFAAWAFLFLLIGPVYYHLVVPVMLILAFADWKRPWRTLVVVILGSAWAGISRVNWFPMPAMTAIALYLLEVPVNGKALWRYLAQPAAWTVAGLAAAAAAQALYAAISGNPADQFASSLTSDLLWYRLWPNPTYPAGIVLSALPVTALPLLAIWAWRAAERSGPALRLHWLRWLGLAAMLIVLAAGGLVVSVKIGGGSNLHNLDAFYTLLLVVGAALAFGHTTPEEGQAGVGPDRPLLAGRRTAVRLTAALILAGTLFVPLVYALEQGSPAPVQPADITARSLSVLQREINDAANESGRILFLGERQLLTFGRIQEAALEPDYERVFLMEMAMARNPEYLGRFRQRLASREFALIVSEPLYFQFKGPEESFGEENDAWVREVSIPVLCNYEPLRTLREVRVQILVPRTEPSDAPQCAGWAP